MYFGFLAILVILIWVFVLVLLAVTVPLGMLEFLLLERGVLAHPRRIVMMRQITLSLVATAFIAVVCSGFVVGREPSNAWLYALTGFIATLILLSHDVHRLASEPPPGADPHGLHEPALTGAILGLPLSLLAYPFLYTWPHLVTVLPGTEAIIEVSLAVGLWLTSFKWVITLSLLVALAYLLNAGCFAVFIAVGLLMSLPSLLRKASK